MRPAAAASTSTAVAWWLCLAWCLPCLSPDRVDVDGGTGVDAPGAESPPDDRVACSVQQYHQFVQVFSARAKRSPDAVRFYSLRHSSIADLSNTEARTQCDDHRSLGYADIHDHQSPLIQPCSSAIPCCLPEPYSPAASNRNPGATSLTFAHQHQYRTRTNRERVPDPQAISTSAVSAVSASVRVSCQYHHGEVRPSP